jgi:hypothetical protein
MTKDDQLAIHSGKRTNDTFDFDAAFAAFALLFRAGTSTLNR